LIEWEGASRRCGVHTITNSVETIGGQILGGEGAIEMARHKATSLGCKLSLSLIGKSNSNSQTNGETESDTGSV
jgi:hypothetical protein